VGDKFILFVTDGQPDYCDDGNATCPPDSVVAGLQNLKKANIETFVFGITSPLSTFSGPTLQAFANAGDGQPVVPALDAGKTITSIYDECAGVAGWAADFAMTGKTAARGATIGDYVTSGGGTAKVYMPDPSNQTALVNQISAVLSGVKSCTFDLGNLDGTGQKIKVDLTQLDKAQVIVQGTAVPLSDTNGWHMASDTQLELVGGACDNWRKPDVTDIDFKFPCDVIIIL